MRYLPFLVAQTVSLGIKRTQTDSLRYEEEKEIGVRNPSYKMEGFGFCERYPTYLSVAA